MRRLAIVAAVAGTASFMASSGWAQTTWFVDLNGTPPGTGSQVDPYTSIQFAISQPGTLPGDTVQVAPGTYVENLDFLGKDLVVQSSGDATDTIVDGNDAGSVVLFVNGETSAAVLDGFRLQNGRNTIDAQGGGVRCVGASPTLRNLVVTDNEAVRGSGVYLEASNATLSDSDISGNRSNQTGSIFAGDGFGCGVLATCDSDPLVERCVISSNREARFGGGVYGAGRYVECQILDNIGYEGAGAYSAGCQLTLTDCRLADNRCFGSDFPGGPGGGVYGPATLIDCDLQNNRSFFKGGGAFEATLQGCDIRDNRALGSYSGPAEGAGAHSCDLDACNVFRNTLLTGFPSFGAGVYGGTVTNSRIYANTITTLGDFVAGFAGRGAGAAFATLSGCEVFGNSALRNVPFMSLTGGGGLAFCQAERCVIYGNTADQGAGVIGGSLDHCVVTENTAVVENGGVEAATMSSWLTTTVSNTVLWDNTSPEILVSGGTTSVTYNLVQGGFSGTGNFSAPPRFYGPEVKDFRLKSDSPCIDAGDPLSPPDPDASVADVGAFPFDAGYCPSARAYCVAKVNSQGCTPEIGSTGTPSMTGTDDFVITAANVRNDKIGYLFYGNVADAVPFMGGTLCVRPPLRRFGVQLSGGSPGSQQDCSGTYSFHFTQARLQSAGLFAPQTIHLQILYRDPPIGDGSGAGLTDALEATICP